MCIAAHAGDHTIYPDCRLEFMDSISAAMNHGTYAKVQLLTPFIAQRKEGIAEIAEQLNIDLSQTWSCYKGGEVHCGKCGTCVERKEAFQVSGIKDTTVYMDT